MDKIATGLIRTTHGIRGYLKVKIFSGDADNFLEHTKLLLKKNSQEKLYTIEESFLHGDSVLIKLSGIDTPEAGKLLNGWEIWISRDEASPLDDDEYYQADLHGCSVLFEGSVIGKVLSLVEGAQSDLLEIEKTVDEARCYVPFMNEFVSEVDIKNKTIELRNVWILG